MKGRGDMKTNGSCKAALAATFLVGTCLAQIAKAEDPFELELILRGAYSPASESLLMDLSRENGMWRPVRAGLWSHGSNAHRGYVVSNEVSDTSMRFSIAMQINNDAWVQGGYAKYDITLTKGTGSVWSGRFEGQYKGRTLTNVVTGRVKPPRPIRYPGWKPFAPNEHPRILVRKDELPRLRERLKTPFGQAAMQMMQGDLLGLALLYQLTGEKSYADKTVPLFEKAVTVMDGGHTGENFRGHQRNVGMALDLCCDAIPTDVRLKVEEYLWRFIEAAANDPQWFSSGMNTHPCSNYYGPIIGSMAIASLYFYGTPGPEPTEPLPPLGMKSSGGDALSKLVNKYASADKMELERQAFEHKMTAWRASLPWWKANGGQDVERLTYLERMDYQMYRTFRLGIGDGGFQSEISKYSFFALNNPVTYAALYQRVFGRDPSAFPDAVLFLPRQMMQDYYSGLGKSDNQEINGWNPLQVAVLAEAFNLVPDQYRPGLLWAWNHLTGVTGPENVTNALKAGPVFAFVNYPLEMKPVHPNESMPKTWYAPTRGLCVFRSGWDGKDEFISQVFAKSTPIKGWSHPNAGTFRIFGLGHAWVGKPIGKRTNVRELQSAVILPDDEIEERGCGQIPWFQAEKDGSGAVAVDYAMVYGRGELRDPEEEPVKLGEAPPPTFKPLSRSDIEKKKAAEKRGPARVRLVDGNFVLYPENLDPKSIKGWRAIAFDYSGKCGAPCLMAMVDKVEGGKRKEWVWQAPADDDPKAKGPVAAVKTEGNSFVLDYGDANMRGTFAAPAKVTLSHRTDPGSIMMSTPDGMKALPYDRNQVLAKGETGTEGLFIMVATFQRGPAPEIKFEGSGLGTVATVGSRKIRFAEERITIGE
jgi:hypothetical protein